MPILSSPRTGSTLRIKGRPLEFSFWPLERNNRRYGLGARVFATDPWTVIHRAIEDRLTGIIRDSALALNEQAEDFYRAADSGVKAAKPLLLYYCYMNLAKCFALHSGTLTIVDNAQHGLTSSFKDPRTDDQIQDTILDAYRSPNRRGEIQNFDVMLEAITGNKLPSAKATFELSNILPQIVPGHRLWLQSRSIGAKERFVSIAEINFMTDPNSKTIWLQFFVFADALKRINKTHQAFTAETRLDSIFQEVKCDWELDGRDLLCFEQVSPITYSGQARDKIPELVQTVKPLLWQTVLSNRPYRKYYLYASPASEHSGIMPQLASIYAITYFLGSIVRYRPREFDDILDGQYGPFIQAFLNDQANQFIYLMASEFVEREVTRAAIV